MISMDEAYRAHAQTVYRYLFSLTHDAALSEELTQDTFYQAVKSADRFDGSCRFTTWLCAIAKRLLLSYRRRRRPDAALTESAALCGSAEQDALSSLSRAALLKRLHGLEEPLREVMYLRAFGALSFCEIGDILGRTENWARVTFYRGKERLKKEMKTDEN